MKESYLMEKSHMDSLSTPILLHRTGSPEAHAGFRWAHPAGGCCPQSPRFFLCLCSASPSLPLSASALVLSANWSPGRWWLPPQRLWEDSRPDCDPVTFLDSVIVTLAPQTVRGAPSPRGCAHWQEPGLPTKRTESEGHLSYPP